VKRGELRDLNFSVSYQVYRNLGSRSLNRKDRHPKISVGQLTPFLLALGSLFHVLYNIVSRKDMVQGDIVQPEEQGETASSGKS